MIFDLILLARQRQLEQRIALLEAERARSQAEGENAPGQDPKRPEQPQSGCLPAVIVLLIIIACGIAVDISNTPS